jgi:hypothetical protein
MPLTAATITACFQILDAAGSSSAVAKVQSYYFNAQLTVKAAM